MEENKIKCKSICIISDHLQHKKSVHCFIHEVLKYLKELIPYFNHSIYFSDGASSQYKNYKNIYNLCYHKQDHEVSAEWHFFATSHGKSACDGVGGTFKRLVARVSLQSLTDPINSSEKMYDWCRLREDICWVPITHVLCKISSLKVRSAIGSCYELSAHEKTKILHLYNSIYNNKII
nr:uncharacterized protein LOC124812388 [Hydra vulgaris]